MENVISRIARLNEIGIALSAESDRALVCDKILKGAMELTNADGGSLYTISDDHQHLDFAIVSTHSLGIDMGGSSGTEINFPPIHLYHNGEPNMSMVVSSAVHDDKTISIKDAYDAPGFDFSGTREFDAHTGYRTQSILTVPMKDHQHEIIGVLQLINAVDEASGEIREFTRQDQQLAESLASQAAISITTNRLINEQRKLFEAFIEVIAAAIDEKSPYTGEHCKRLPELTMMIAEACDAQTHGPLKDFKMTEQDRYELRIAGWLHDCGKVATPEYVIDKATKLQTIYDRINTIDTRFEVLLRDAKIEMLEQKLKRLEHDSKADITELAQAYAETIDQLEDDRTFVRYSNIGAESMSENDQQRIRDIARQQWTNSKGDAVDLLDADEVKNLTIEKGTLNDDERNIINNHIVVTNSILDELPFPKHLQNVPEYAGGHHERMDGKGYPNGLTREQMSLQARMMGIADIFEALTASDRPYKDGKTLTECLSILGNMKLNNHIDPDIFDIFIRDKVYLRYAMQFLPESQIDFVDESGIPGYNPY